MPQKNKIVFMTSERALCIYVIISNELSNHSRVDHHFDDYQRIEEIT